MTAKPTERERGNIANREQAIARLMELAFDFQSALLDYVHDIRPPIVDEYPCKEAEQIADEIQALSHWIEDKRDRTVRISDAPVEPS